MELLSKFGDKAIQFFQANWGKLLTGGFVLLNSDEIITSIENVGKEALAVTGETVSKSVDSISNSNLGLIIGFALILLVFLKFGWDKVVRKKVD